MAKTAIDAQRATVFLMWPEELTIIQDDPSHPLYDERASMDLSESMVKNIMHQGVLQPILIRKNTATGQIEVISGRQRVRCTAEANRRLDAQGLEKRRVPAVLKRGEPHELLGMMASENAIRQKETPLVKAKKISRYLAHGRSEEEAAMMFGCSTGTVKNFLSLLDATPELQAAIESGKVTTSDGYRLAKLKPGEQKAKLAKLEEVAPKIKGVRRERAAKEITGAGSTLRAKSDFVALREQVAVDETVKENTRIVALAILDWALGDDGALAIL